MPKVVDPSLKKGERFMQKVMKMYKNDLARNSSSQNWWVHQLFRSGSLTESDTKMYENHVARVLLSLHLERTMPKQWPTKRPFIWYHICSST